MPSVENHVKFCVKAFGEENRELCYMVNSWIDAPSREKGKAHRRLRHDPDFTPVEACRVYGDYVDKGGEHGLYRLLETENNKLICRMVMQHLKLDGLITPQQEKAWTWKRMWKNIKKRVRNEIEEWATLPCEVLLKEEPEEIWHCLWLEGQPAEERIKEIIIEYIREKRDEYIQMIRKGELVKVNGIYMTKEAALQEKIRKQRKSIFNIGVFLSIIISTLLGSLIGKYLFEFWLAGLIIIAPLIFSLSLLFLVVLVSKYEQQIEKE